MQRNDNKSILANTFSKLNEPIGNHSGNIITISRGSGSCVPPTLQRFYRLAKILENSASIYRTHDPILNDSWPVNLRENNNKENNMMKITENQYLINCVKSNGDIETFIPVFAGTNEGSFIRSLSDRHVVIGERKKTEHVFDYHDLMKWVKENLFGKYVGVIISKVSGALEFKTESVMVQA